MSTTMNDASRGRHATRPSEIPRKGWRDILLRVKQEISDDNISMIAAGVAFYGILAIFPALGALVSLYGLIANPADVEQQMMQLRPLLPKDAFDLLATQMHTIASTSSGALGIGFISGLFLTLWSAAKGSNALITAMNIAYDEQETRGFFRLNFLAMLFTVGGILLLLLALTSIVVIPSILSLIGLEKGTEWFVSLVRWPILALFIMAGLSMLYRYGPNRRKAQWKWLTWGGAIATVLWLISSALFSVYVANFGKYNETYGSVGAGVGLLMWFYISSYIVLIGAEINAEMEHQTVKDTTKGQPKPLGERRAFVADTVGKTP